MIGFVLTTQFKRAMWSVVSIFAALILYFPRVWFGLFENIKVGIEDYWWIALLIIAGFAGISLHFFNRFFSVLLCLRAIEDTPTHKITSAPQGYVELIGVCETSNGEGLVSPLANKECVWYRYKIEEFGEYGAWEIIESDESSMPFVIKDGDGECIVYPVGADIRTVAGKLVWGGWTPWPDIRKHKSDKEHHDSYVPLISSPPLRESGYRYTEEIIRPGSRVIVVGDFKTVNHDRNKAMSDRARMIFTKWRSSLQSYLERFDLNKDGRVDADEIRLAMRQAKREALVDVSDNDMRAVNYLRAPSDGRPFIISDIHHDALAYKYRLFILPHALGFSAFASAAVAVAWMAFW